MPSHKNSGNVVAFPHRRQFISNTTKAIAAILASAPLAGFMADHTNGFTVGDIMDRFISEVPEAPFANTVDTLKAGHRNIEVTGVVTSMFATIEVIKKAIALNANFIIAHEPTFYNHLDDTTWLMQDEVYQYKAALLKQNNMAVWRNHDYVHSHKPDGVKTEVVKQLDWENRFDVQSNIAKLPSQTLSHLIKHVKVKLGVDTLRYIGDLQQICSSVLLMPGAAGGRRQIEALSKTQPDVLICGEVAEWETAEYVRDARLKGKKLALIVLGHIASEEPGSQYMAQWMKHTFPTIQTVHIPAGNSLQFM